jgi:Zn-dependent metalloprotease
VKPRTPVVVAIATITAASAVMVPGTASAQPTGPTGSADAAAAAATASVLVASRPAYLHAGDHEAFVAHPVISAGNLQYVPYDRTYKGLPMVGGDFVVMTDAAGNAKYTSVSQTRAVGEVSTTPTITAERAEAVARKQLRNVIQVTGTRLVVYALDDAAALAYETTVAGTGANGPSLLTVDVDARTGSVLQTREGVVHGTGNGAIDGSVTINTTQSGSTYRMLDPGVTQLSCDDFATNTTFSGPDDSWGNGVGTDKETGCVDALYAAEKEAQMLSSWLGRSGFNGSGGGWPIRVGWNQVNAQYCTPNSPFCSSSDEHVEIGHNQAGEWIGSADVLGHEMGHGIDEHTPGGISRGNTQEFVADTYGAATEWYANNPNDPPDYLVGEEVNLVGTGPIRNMYDPSALGNDNCYSRRTRREEVHDAAGPGNHWFYLIAQGSAGNGQPASPTCNGSTVDNPLGIQNAIKVMYNAMLMKTSTSSYLKYRTWTLIAAKNLFPGSCTQFNTVKAAWDAVSVPAQAADPTCTGGTATP